MLEFPESKIYKRLVRGGMRSYTVGAVEAAEGDAGRSLAKGALPPIGLTREDARPIRLIVNNTAVRQTARSTASLTIVQWQS